MKTVALLVNEGGVYYTLVIPGTRGLIPYKDEHFYPRVCKHGLCDLIGIDGENAPDVLRVVKLRRKRPGCLSVQTYQDEDTRIRVNGRGKHVFTSFTRAVRDLLGSRSYIKIVPLEV